MTSRNTNPAINRASLSTETNSLASLMANSTRVVVPLAPTIQGYNNSDQAAVYQSVQSLSDRDLTSMVNGNLLDVALNDTTQSFTANKLSSIGLPSKLMAKSVTASSGGDTVTGMFAAFEQGGGATMSTRETSPSGTGPWQQTDGTAGKPGRSGGAANKPFDMDNGGTTATTMSIHQPTPIQINATTTNISTVTLTTATSVNGPYAIQLQNRAANAATDAATIFMVANGQAVDGTTQDQQSWNGSFFPVSASGGTPPTAAQGIFNNFDGGPAASGPAVLQPNPTGINSTMVGCMVQLTASNNLTFALNTTPTTTPVSKDDNPKPNLMITSINVGVQPNYYQSLVIQDELGNTLVGAVTDSTSASTLWLSLGRRTTFGGIGAGGSVNAAQDNSAATDAIEPTLPSVSGNDYFDYFGVGMDTKANAYSLHDALFGNSHKRSTDKSCILRMQDYSKTSSIDMFMGTLNVSGTPNAPAGVPLTKTPGNTPAAEHVRFARAGWGPQTTGTTLNNSSALANAADQSSTRNYFALSKGRLTVILAKWSGADKVMTFVLCGDTAV